MFRRRQKELPLKLERARPYSNGNTALWRNKRVVANLHAALPVNHAAGADDHATTDVDMTTPRIQFHAVPDLTFRADAN